MFPPLEALLSQVRVANVPLKEVLALLPAGVLARAFDPAKPLVITQSSQMLRTRLRQCSSANSSGVSGGGSVSEPGPAPSSPPDDEPGVPDPGLEIALEEKFEHRERREAVVQGGSEVCEDPDWHWWY